MDTSEILNKYKKISVVGFSANPSRPSHWIAEYLNENGYDVFGINPGLDGRTISGIKCFANLSDVPAEIEIVNVFRNPDALPELVNEILELNYKPKVIWTQIGVVNESARKEAEENGIGYIENRCIYVVHKNL